VVYELQIHLVELTIRHLVQQTRDLLHVLERIGYGRAGLLQRGQLISFELESGGLMQDALTVLQHLIERNGAYLKSLIPPIPAMLQGLE